MVFQIKHQLAMIDLFFSLYDLNSGRAALGTLLPPKVAAGRIACFNLQKIKVTMGAKVLVSAPCGPEKICERFGRFSDLEFIINPFPYV
jgi:hypothetical protein